MHGPGIRTFARALLCGIAVVMLGTACGSLREPVEHEVTTKPVSVGQPKIEPSFPALDPGSERPPFGGPCPLPQGGPCPLPGGPPDDTCDDCPGADPCGNDCPPRGPCGGGGECPPPKGGCQEQNNCPDEDRPECPDDECPGRPSGEDDEWNCHHYKAKGYR